MFIDTRKEVKDKTVVLRISTKQKRLLESMAEDKGLKVSQFLMTLIEKEWRTPKR